MVSLPPQREFTCNCAAAVVVAAAAAAAAAPPSGQRNFHRRHSMQRIPPATDPTLQRIPLQQIPSATDRTLQRILPCNGSHQQITVELVRRVPREQRPRGDRCVFTKVRGATFSMWTKVYIRRILGPSTAKTNFRVSFRNLVANPSKSRVVASISCIVHPTRA